MLLRSVFWVYLLVSCSMAFSQAPIVYNDTATVVQFSFDTINVAANDSSPNGDSLCIKAVYGSPNFTLINCSSIAYHPDTTFTGTDSCHYIICDADTALCDTGLLLVNVNLYYRPFMLRNSKWVVMGDYDNCGNGYPNDEVITYDSYVTGNTDTIINGKSYYALNDVSQNQYSYYCGSNYVIYSDNFTANLIGYLRQDTLAHKVFMLYAGTGQDSLLYDFSLQIGDSLRRNSIFSPIIYLWKIDSFESGGVYYRQYRFTGPGGGDTWIEGIGSYGGLFISFESLYCFSHNDTAIYPSFNADSTCANGDIISSVKTIVATSTPQIYPNPATNTITITGLQPHTPIIVTNLLGQALISTVAENNRQTLDISRLASGMYFVNNMKLVKE